MTETVMKILLERPSNAYDMFENISADVKMNPLNPGSTCALAVPPSAEEVRDVRKFIYPIYTFSIFIIA